MKKLSITEQEYLIPDAEILKAFLKRHDIVNLTPAEQQIRWTKHKISLDKFREQLSQLDSILSLTARSR